MAIQQTIYDVLQREHRRLSGLLEQLKKTRDRRTRDILFERVATELTAHADAEAVTLYAVLQRDPETSSETERAGRALDRLSDLLQELEGSRHDRETWERKLDELRRAVERHVEEDEEEIFPDAQSILADDQSRALAARFLEEKAMRTS